MVHLTTSYDMLTLTVTIGHAAQLTANEATTEEWNALTDALLAEHTPEELANMLTGACAIIARTGART